MKANESQEKPIGLKEVIQKEQEHLRMRRKNLGIEHGTESAPNWFGIALSGGGIRSATINLGFLKTLNKYGILQKADYLSSVSGGGYTHSYVQGTAKQTGDYSKLFCPEHIEAMRRHGEYMVPHTGWFGKTGNMLLLILAFIVSWIMSLVSPVLVIGILYYGFHLFTDLLSLIYSGVDPTVVRGLVPESWIQGGMMVVFGVIIVHLMTNIVLNFNLGVSKLFNYVELILAPILAVFLFGPEVLAWFLQTIHSTDNVTLNSILDSLIIIALLLGIGLFTNPNALSFHRFYRKQLADLFLRFSGDYDNLELMKVFNAKSTNQKDYISPYPLINTCLNLLNPQKDEAFQGTKTSDYFLLSPFFCGSKLVGYVPTDRYSDYQRMTLPAAVTISAAAVNPGMGMYSNKVLSLFMTMFNFRLGFWISNPLVLVRTRAIVWWPLYFFYELLGRIGSRKKMINISDGGHIENLGAYELLRRGCRLIIAVDAGEDKIYSFADLNNLIMRARNEMGLEIRFRPHEQPEELIRPRPSQVYSAKRFAVADIYKCWEEIEDPAEPDCKRIVNYSEKEREANGPVGTFIYVKSSVRAPEGKPDLDKHETLKYGTYKYKIYHPDFPHEPTSDQFFDEIQWEAYFQLGRYIGAEVLGVRDLEAAADKPTVEDLLAWFDQGVNFFNQPEPASAGAEPEGGYESFKLPTAEPAAAPPVEEEVKYQM